MSSSEKPRLTAGVGKARRWRSFPPGGARFPCAFGAAGETCKECLRLGAQTPRPPGGAGRYDFTWRAAALQTTRRLVRAGGPAAVGAGWNMPRFLRQMDARNARAASVRRKDGPCHSERRVGMGPARKRAATKRIPRTAWTAPSRRGTCAATQYRAQHGPRLQGAGHAKQLFSAKRLTRRKDGAIIPPINAEGGRAGMKAARMDHSSAYSFTFSFTFARKALLRCAV